MFLRASLSMLPAAPMNGMPVRISSRAGPIPTMATRASRGPLAIIVSGTPVGLESHYLMRVEFTSHDISDEVGMKKHITIIDKDAESFELLIRDFEAREVVKLEPRLDNGRLTG